MSYLSTSDSYTNTYGKTKESAYNSMEVANAAFNPTFTSIGASLAVATGGWSMLLGLADVWAWGSNRNKAKQAAKTAILNQADVEKAKFEDYKYSRNQYLNRTNRFINNTKSSFDATFGAGTYDEFDAMYKSQLSGYSLSELMSAAKKWESGVEDEDTANLAMMFNGMSQEEIDSLLTESMSIIDINDAYKGYLSERFANQDTAYGKQMATASRNEEYTAQQYKQSLNATAQQFSQQMQSAVAEARQGNISNAESLGSAEAAAGSSGIRQSGSGRNNVNIQNYNAMLQSVQYASAISYITEQYKNQLESTQAGYLYQSFANRNTVEQSKLQQVQNYINSGNEANDKLADFYYQIDAIERDAATAYATYKGYMDAYEEYTTPKQSETSVPDTSPTVEEDIDQTIDDEGTNDTGTVVTRELTDSEIKKKELKNDLKTMTAQELGAKYGLSDESFSNSFSWFGMHATTLDGMKDEKGHSISMWDWALMDNEQRKAANDRYYASQIVNN